MRLDEIFLPGAQADGITASSKRQVLTEVAAAFAASHGLDASRVFEVLHERERLGSTAIGGGIAIPHGKLAGLSKMAGCVIRLSEPVNFEANDGQAVDLVVALLAPDTSGAEHLRVLSRLSRMLRDPHESAALRACPDAESLRLALTAEAVQQRAA